MAEQFRGGPPNLGAFQVQARFQQALSLHQRGEIAQAQAIYREVLQHDPKHFDSLHFLGVAYAQTGQLDIAIEHISRAIEINPAASFALFNLGNAQRDLKRYEEALSSYDRALAVTPAYPEAHNNRGNTLRSLKRLEEALESYDKAISVKPDYAEAHNNRGNVLRTVGALLLMCDPRDLGVAVSENPASGAALFEPNLYLYDNFPGGIGQSAALFKLAPRLVDSAAQLVAACGCEAGCPSCVGPVGEVGERGKDTAQRLLTALRA